MKKNVRNIVIIIIAIVTLTGIIVSTSITPASDKSDSAGTKDHVNLASPDQNTDQKIHQDTITCKITIDCSLLTDGSALTEAGNENKIAYVPKDGKILFSQEVTVDQGSSVYDVLKTSCRSYDIPFEATYTAGLETYYVEGINHLYEFDAGSGSGWVFFVNGDTANYGASDVQVQQGDDIVWMYSLNYGLDVQP